MMANKRIFVAGDETGTLYSHTPFVVFAREQMADGTYSDAFPVTIPESFQEIPLYPGHRIEIVPYGTETIYLWRIDFGDGSRMIDHIKGIQVDHGNPVCVVLPQFAYQKAWDYLPDMFDHQLKALKREHSVTVSSLPPNHFLQHINEKMGDDKDVERLDKHNLRLMQKVFDAARSDGIDVLVLTW